MRVRTLVAAVLVSLAGALPAPASAQLTLAFRIGYGIGRGDVRSGAALADFVDATVPVTIDGLWRFGALSAGAYVSYADDYSAPVLKARCTSISSGSSCSSAGTRAGLEAQWAFSDGFLRPWAGASLGWEWLLLDLGGGKGSFSGPEGTVQLGLDLSATSSIGVGPYVSASAGRYVDATGMAIPGANAWHAWYVFGLRGRFDL